MADAVRPPIDLKKIYVDHLVDGLERRSIFEIVLFLSRYCGWDTIKEQMDKHVSDLEKDKQLTFFEEGTVDKPTITVTTRDEDHTISYELRVPLSFFEEADLDAAIMKSPEGTTMSTRLHLLANILEQHERKNG